MVYINLVRHDTGVRPVYSEEDGQRLTPSLAILNVVSGT